MTQTDFSKFDRDYFALVVEAAHSLDVYGMVDIETASQADAMGFTTSTLTEDAVEYNRQSPN